MRITQARAYRQFQPFVDGTYGTSAASADGFDSTIVAVTTDEGVTGWGEMAPLGSFYSDAFAGGARAGVEELLPALVGEELDHPARLMRLLDRRMRGQPFVKSAVDMALWDAHGRALGRPLAELWGGGDRTPVELYRAIPMLAPAEAAERARAYTGAGYRRLQVKVGGDPAIDAERVRAVIAAVGAGVPVYADANGGFTTAAARRFLRLVADLDIVVEQPCATLAECRAVRSWCAQPMVLDESITSLEALLEARRDGTADGVTLKLSRLGGITPALLLRDAACELGAAVTIEDTGGASIDTAATLHLMRSTPAARRAHTVDFNAWVTVDNASGVPEPQGGAVAAPSAAGLGIEVLEAALGEPFCVARGGGA